MADNLQINHCGYFGFKITKANEIDFYGGKLEDKNSATNSTLKNFMIKQNNLEQSGAKMQPW